MTTHHNFVLAPAALLASPNVTFNPSNQWIRDGSLICSTSEGSKASTKFIGMMGTIATLSVIGNITLSPSMIHSKNLTTFLVSTITLDDVSSCVISFDIPSGALNTATPLLCSVPLLQDGEEHTVALTNNFSGALVCLQNFSMEITGVVNSLANETSPNNIESTPTLPSTSTTSSFTSSSLAGATSLISSTSSTTGSWSSSAEPTIGSMTGDHDSANASASKRDLRLIIAASLAGPLPCLLIAISVLFSKSQKSRSCSLPFWSDNSFRKIDPYRTHCSLFVPPCLNNLSVLM
ncbi:hypothetical protein SISNIDRAFT_125935 [Sistotremastrum niveocremeum HHB9708]|uniref:Uncharacterized protein n=1 Tax=Sistotremastrum niveocremeum HHB9708 TaxID=1314777 RepID=A0A164TBT0_9AGAM|nr:hypothetical protein SISNIDRAFT_125935 [Sistotremastrum niveocremeum HHB9708]